MAHFMPRQFALRIGEDAQSLYVGDRQRSSKELGMSPEEQIELEGPNLLLVALGLVAERQKLPTTVIGTREPPLVVFSFGVRLPGSTAFDGGMVVGEHLGNLRVVSVFV